MTDLLQLLSDDELKRRLTPICEAMNACGVDAMLISDHANQYYLTGRVFCGYVWVEADGQVKYLVKRPVELEGDNVVYYRRLDELAGICGVPQCLGLEEDLTPYSSVMRLRGVFGVETSANVSLIMRQARAVKTPFEIERIWLSGVKHDQVYRHIPGMYRPGMTDIELQVEIERRSRLEGCLGQFRISGDSMELFMGNVIAGANADAPSPYDFAMGGAGMDPSLPVGANGTELREGMAVMVDVNGNFNGYMTDLTRTFSVGKLTRQAYEAHDLSIAIHRELMRMGVPGAPAKELYAKAMSMVEEAGLKELFMGHRQHAAFIGHGVGIEVNELPVIAPRSRDILSEGNVIALEPKFVIPSVGAVGIETTYLVTSEGLKPFNHLAEEIIDLQ